MADLKHNPLHEIIALQKEHRMWRRGHNEEKYLTLQNIVLIEHQFRQEFESWYDFCELDYWHGEKSRPKPEDSSKAIRYLLVFLYGRGRRQRQTASLHEQALQYLLVIGVDRKRIAREIKKFGGLRKIGELAARDRRIGGRSASPGEIPSIAASVKKRSGKREGSADKRDTNSGKLVAKVYENDPVIVFCATPMTMRLFSEQEIGETVWVGLKKTEVTENGFFYLHAVWSGTYKQLCNRLIQNKNRKN